MDDFSDLYEFVPIFKKKYERRKAQLDKERQEINASRFERLRYVIHPPIRKVKHPIKLIKEYFQKGRYPLDIYKLQKKYHLTRQGLKSLFF